MRYIALFLSLFLALFASSSLSIGAKETPTKEATEEVDKTIYTVQLFTQYDKKQAKKMLKKLPLELQPDAYLLKSGESIKGRYSSQETYSAIKPYLEQIKNAGFKDAFVVKSSSMFTKENKIDQDDDSDAKEQKAEETVQKEEIKQSEEIVQKEERAQKEEIKPREETKIKEAKTPTAKEPKEKKQKLSQTAKTELLLKAQSAYERGDESEAMIYYEMLLAANEASQKAKSNLCYLYGKKGAWMQAKNLIEAQEFNGKLLYSYAYGAVLSNQENFYEDMLPYISLDSSGRLLLLAGYYFEKRHDNKKAASFYKMAYEKNKSDHYHKYAYARALDIEQNKEAYRHYKELLAQVETSHPLHASIQKRVNELGE